MDPSRRKILVSTAAALALSSRAWAQPAYPSKPIRIVVGFPAGGALDVATRALTQALAVGALHPIVVDNKVGAGGTIALTEVARAAPDGYTLGLGTTSNLVIAPYLYPRLAYKAEADLVSLGEFAQGQSLVYASTNSGLRTLSAAIAAMRNDPGKLSYASPGTGTTAHLSFEMFKARDKLFIVHVPYRGTPQAMNAVASGEVELGVDAIGPVLPLIRAGRVVPLAQSGERRSDFLRDVPTLKELGFPEIVGTNGLGLVAPAALGEPVRALIQAELQKAVDQQEFLAHMNNLGLQAAFRTGSEVRDGMKAQQAFWARAVRHSGATND
ncbi:Bug family tripartite tricarboxylate transporter substrate binding protein [Variovorax sp. RA8]|uniref:Bug family tripartite tricarboxylate transporter substrate binding protein n=1 Tax=Variovorax sp. (strain JCM 16519 / RA8) TaxID=662548 RepID=UPI001317BE70|nr:tripartite tricarboxylate transporter substrate binding protein [Variovorax sp. RA8]VTU29717.1 Argininosuccinate lyase [Variovorax sp. RA8]